jgi:malonate-semialdehyde dehydrogenase (acetylating)/methylmalonate-semialdehyde dehydrogenase
MSTLTNSKVIKNFINGEWVEASPNAKIIPVPNPATEEILALVPLSTKLDLENAVKAAKKAFITWSKTPVPKRARILFSFQQLLIKNWDELANLITIEKWKKL